MEINKILTLETYTHSPIKSKSADGLGYKYFLKAPKN